ncbi:hypothetical protein KC614_02460 [candidate division WWE3 bacterium]|uniref:Uncharacterized protein n=1 Tax=candidate division WWE3 bacterium TaxID=2053526 RepID=A0A955LK75_UNCKA|nr:hypothetical protein [candidate division WWE3 bacterium]
MFGSNFIVKESTIQRIVDNAYSHVRSHGQRVDTSQGPIKALNSVTLILEDPSSADGRYPFWDKESEDWYLNTFVSPTAAPPESHDHDLIFPYTYAWRSRHHDDGWGYVVALTNILQALNYSDLPFERVDDLKQLLRETYHTLHPDVVLAVLSWLKRENMLLFLINSQIPQEILKASRNDVLGTLVKQLVNTPSSRKAITPSFYYNTTDRYGILEHTPAYQNYQIVIDFDQQGSPVGFESFHQHRSLDASGSIQLDFAHDINWAGLISQKLGIPVQKITIHTNQLFIDDGKSDSEEQPSNIKNLLLKATSGYSPKEFDVESYIGTEKYEKKLEYALSMFSHQSL